MKTRRRLLMAGSTALASLLLLILDHPVRGHATDVHGSAANNLTQKAIDTAGVSLQPTDVTRMKQGSVDEDMEVPDLWNGSLLRFQGHHYNPHTGTGGPFFGSPAASVAENRWGLMRTAFGSTSYRWNGDETAGAQGSLHALGRVLHLLEDMSSPPHVHARDGHGQPLINGPGESEWGLGYYSDFEYTWSPSSSVYSAWPFPAVTGGPMTPETAFIASYADRASWNSKLDSSSWSEMTGKLSAIPASELHLVRGYMKAQAWISYFHTSFYGQINKDQGNPAPISSATGRTSILRQMFPGRISFHGGFFDDYWTIDGVGYYGRSLQYFPNDWWPCPDPGTEPIGHTVDASGNIRGRFYVYMHFYRVDSSIGPITATFSQATPPDYWPDGSTNSGTSLAKYYGNVLLPLSARFGAGLLRELFAAPGSLNYPAIVTLQGTTGQVVASWASVSTDAGNVTAYVLDRSNNGGASWTNVYTGTGTSFTDSLSAGTYVYRVRARWFDASAPIYGAIQQGQVCTVAPPGPNPTSLNVTAILTPNTGVPAYTVVNVDGTAMYNTGAAVAAGTVIIGTGNNTYTASVSNGRFNQNIYSPASSGNISITVNDSRYGLSATIQRWIDIEGSQNGSGYTLSNCDVIYKRQSDSSGVTWWSKDAYATTNQFVETLLYFTNVYRALDVRWRYYRPDGSQYGSDLYYHIANPADSGYEYWSWSWCSNGYLINGYCSAWPTGLYKVKVWIDNGTGYNLVRTKYFTIQYELTEQKMCKDVQGSSPYDPATPTNVFYQDDVKAETWANLDWVAQALEAKWEYYGPDSVLYGNSTFSITDPGASGYLQWDWYRIWGWIGISGNSAASKCGDWSVKVYIKNACTNVWENLYTDHFQILERPAVMPSVSVAASPAAPIEGQAITLNVSGSDNTYLKKVVLSWTGGSQTWDNIIASSASKSQQIGPFAAGTAIEVWSEAWDTSGNRSESQHRTFTVQPETVTAPSIPAGPAALYVNQLGVFTTGGSTTNLGHAVQYQFDWGDGITSSWSGALQSHSWSPGGQYFVKAKARCQLHANRESDWSTVLLVLVDSTAPAVTITNPTSGDSYGTTSATIDLGGIATDNAGVVQVTWASNRGGGRDLYQ